MGKQFNPLMYGGAEDFSKLSGMLANHDQQWQQYMENCGRDKDSFLVNHEGTLKFDDHIMTTEETLAVRRRSLNGVADLMARGLTRSANLEDMMIRYHNRNEFNDAQRSMNPVMGQTNQSDYADVLTPLPIIFSEWFIPYRQSGFSYKNADGNAESTRKVAESWEKLLFLGDDTIQISVGGTNSVIYGYINHPATITTTISDWTVDSTGVVADTLGMIQLMFEQAAVSTSQSVLMMYVSNDVWVEPLADDYSTAKGDRTFIERLKAIPGIIDIKPAEYLPAKSVCIVEMLDRTIQMGIASDIVSIPWTRTQPMENQKFTTFAAATPLIKQDRNVKTGILYATMV